MMSKADIKRAFYQRHRDLLREKARKCYQVNKLKVDKTTYEWRDKNQEKYLNYQREYYAKKKIDNERTARMKTNLNNTSAFRGQGEDIVFEKEKENENHIG